MEPWILSSVVELEYCPNGALEAVSPKGGYISLTSPVLLWSSQLYTKRPRPYLPKETISKSYYEKSKSKLNINMTNEYWALLVELYYILHTVASEAVSPEGDHISCSLTIKYRTKYCWLTCWVWLYRVLAELLDYRICTTPELCEDNTESHHTAGQ